MHESVMEYVEGAIRRYGLATGRTLELGSANVNGSVRPLFSGEYVGIDHEQAAGVDIVMSAAALTFEDASDDPWKLVLRAGAGECGLCTRVLGVRRR